MIISESFASFDKVSQARVLDEFLCSVRFWRKSRVKLEVRPVIETLGVPSAPEANSSRCSEFRESARVFEAPLI